MMKATQGSLSLFPEYYDSGLFVRFVRIIVSLEEIDCKT